MIDPRANDAAPPDEDLELEGVVLHGAGAEQVLRDTQVVLMNPAPPLFHVLLAHLPDGAPLPFERLPLTGDLS